MRKKKSKLKNANLEIIFNFAFSRVLTFTKIPSLPTPTSAVSVSLSPELAFVYFHSIRCEEDSQSLTTIKVNINQVCVSSQIWLEKVKISFINVVRRQIGKPTISLLSNNQASTTWPCWSANRRVGQVTPNNQMKCRN